MQDQEQSLLDAIAKLGEASDRENGKLLWVVTILEFAIVMNSCSLDNVNIL